VNAGRLIEHWVLNHLRYVCLLFVAPVLQIHEADLETQLKNEGIIILTEFIGVVIDTL